MLACLFLLLHPHLHTQKQSKSTRPHYGREMRCRRRRRLSIIIIDPSSIWTRASPARRATPLTRSTSTSSKPAPAPPQQSIWVHMTPRIRFPLPRAWMRMSIITIIPRQLRRRYAGCWKCIISLSINSGSYGAAEVRDGQRLVQQGLFRC